MKIFNFKIFVFLFLVSFFLVLCFAQSSFSTESPRESITYNVPESADVVKVSFFIKEYKNKDRLHMKVGIKNVSKDNARYRVNIYLPDGVAGGGMYPRKADYVEANSTHSRTFPMYYDELPSHFEIVVKELKD